MFCFKLTFSSSKILIILLISSSCEKILFVFSDKSEFKFSFSSICIFKSFCNSLYYEFEYESKILDKTFYEEFKIKKDWKSFELD
jgi:hypothetical protein